MMKMLNKNLNSFSRESNDYSNAVDGRNEFNEKTSTKGYEGITNGRIACKRRY